MTTIVTRTGKGSPLTHVEVDTNFTNLNTNKIETALTSANILIGNSGGVAAGVGVTGDVTISNTGVTTIGTGVIIDADINASAAIAGSKISPDFGAQTIVTTGVVTIGGLNAVSTTKAQNEESQIKLNAAFSVGTAGAIPFGIGPVIPPGMAFFGIGPDAYNPIHLASGSFC